MPNPNGKTENLIPQSERSPDERREIARRGGIASGKARKKKAHFYKLVRMAQVIKVKNEKGEEKTLEELAALKLVQAAATGDIKAMQFMVEITGEKFAYLEDEDEDEEDEQ